MADSTAKLNVLIALKSAMQGGDSTTAYLTRLSTGLLATAGALAVFAGKQGLAFGSQVTDLASQAQMSTDALQTLAAIGGQAGLSMEALAKASEKLRSNLQSARENGASPLNTDLARLNLTAAGLQALAPERQWEEIAIAISKAADKQSALNAAGALFGEKNLPKLQELLGRLSSEGYDKLADLTKNLRVSPEDLKTLDDAGDKLAFLALHLKVIAAQGTSMALQPKNLAMGITGAISAIPGFSGASLALKGAGLLGVGKKKEGQANAEEALKALDKEAAATVAATKVTEGHAESVKKMAAANAELSEKMHDIAEMHREVAQAEANEKAEADYLTAAQAEANSMVAAGLSPLQQYEQALARIKSLLGDRLLSPDEAAASAAMAKQKLDAATTIPAAQLELNERLLSIGRQRADLDNDFSRSAAEKWNERKRLIAEEIAAQEKYLANLVKLRDASAPGSGARQGYERDVNSATGALSGLESQSGAMGADPQSYGQQAIAALTDVQDSFGTTAQIVGQGISSVFLDASSSLGGAIKGLLSGTVTLGQAWQTMVGSFRDSMINAVSDMLAKWVVSTAVMVIKYGAAKAAMFAIDLAMGAKSLAMSLANAALSLVGWIPSAIAASISSFGVAATLGVAAVVAAVAMGGFEDGGHTGGRRGQVAGVVHGEEFVFSAPAVDRMGADNLDALHQNLLSPSSSGGGEGGSGSSGRGKPSRVIHVQARSRSEAANLMRDPNFDSEMLDWTQRHRGELAAT